MAETEQNVIELRDDDDNVLRFEHLLTFEYDGDLFVAFTPISDMDEYKVGEVLVMRIQPGPDGSDEDLYLPIDSQEELDELWEVFQDLYYDEEELDGSSYNDADERP